MSDQFSCGPPSPDARQTHNTKQARTHSTGADVCCYLNIREPTREEDMCILTGATTIHQHAATKRCCNAQKTMARHQ
jgi:hypothetical protein